MTGPALFGDQVPFADQPLFEVENGDAANDVRRMIVEYGQRLDDVHALLHHCIRNDVEQCHTYLTPRRIESVVSAAVTVDAKLGAIKGLRLALDVRHVDAWVQRVEMAGPGRHLAEAQRVVAESYALDSAIAEEVRR